jgi:hypothetical protein
MKSIVVSVSLLLAATAFAGTPVRVEIVPLKANGAADRTGDVVAILDDGRSERLTQNKHCLDPKVGPGGLVGWTWASEKYKGDWVNEHLRVQQGKKMLVDAKTEKPFIEEWGFAPQGVVAKSRALHGPAKIELFSLQDGHRIAVIDAFADDLPAWAEPFKER